MPKCTPSTTAAQAVQRLRLFNQKAEELSRLSFASKAFAEDAGSTIDFDFEKGSVTQQKRGADRESTAALVLTLRMFLQERDGIKLEQIASVYQEMPLPAEDKFWVAENLKILNAFLDKTGVPEIAIDGEKITHRKILDTFLYGDLAHANDDKRPTYELWRSGPAALILESTFEYIVGQVLKYIYWLRNMNVEAIRVLEGQHLASN
jgi:hypothetical protein